MENQWELKVIVEVMIDHQKESLGTTSSLDLLNTKIWLVRQPTTTTIMMNMNPLVAVVPVNVLCIQLPKYHGNDDLIIQIQQLIKVCVTKGEDIDDHKL